MDIWDEAPVERTRRVRRTPAEWALQQELVILAFERRAFEEAHTYVQRARAIGEEIGSSLARAPALGQASVRAGCLQRGADLLGPASRLPPGWAKPDVWGEPEWGKLGGVRAPNSLKVNLK